jgi:predicted DNA-binding protein
MGMVQAGIRMDASLYERLKRFAKKQNRSLNNYVVTILEEATAPVFPHVEDKDLQIDEDLLRLGEVIGDVPEELLNNDPKLAYILSK